MEVKLTYVNLKGLVNMNKLSCGPKIRISEVEVDIVCAYYGLSEEVSKYIQRLAFSNHLPFTIPTRVYHMTARGLYIMYPHGSLFIMHSRGKTAIQCAEHGRRDSISKAIKSIRNAVDAECCDVFWYRNLRNEVSNHIFTIDGISRQNIQFDDGDFRQVQRPYKCITRNTWQ